MSKEQNPAVPYSPGEFAEEAHRCMNAGAAVVHVHVRNQGTGRPTADLDQILTTIGAIRDKCPGLIINMRSAIGKGYTPEQRIAPIEMMKPEMASLNRASMNIGLANHKTGEIMMEFIFENTFKMLKDFSTVMRQQNPEVMCLFVACL